MISMPSDTPAWGCKDKSLLMHLTNMAVLLMTSCPLPWNDLAIHGIAFFPATAAATHLHLAAGQVVVFEVTFENRANERDMSKR